MASKSKDPFNFDDIYRQAGVDNLFVKKSLSEMKKTTGISPRTASPSPTPKPPQNGIAAVAAVVGAEAGHGVPSSILSSSRQSSAASLTGTDDTFAAVAVPSRMSQTRSPTRVGLREDVGLDGAQATTVQSSAAFNFDDMFGPTSRPEPQMPPHSIADPFAVFDMIDGASPIVVDVSAVHPSPPLPAPVAPVAVSSATSDDHLDLFGFGQAARSPTTTPPAYQGQPAAPEFKEEMARPSSTADLNQQAATKYFAEYESTADYSSDAPDVSYASAEGAYAEHTAPSQTPHPYAEVEGKDSRGSKSLLKGLWNLGRKAIKVTQAGLQQLEAQIEKLEERPRRDYLEHNDSTVSSDEALAIAIGIAELPSNKQEEELARLPRGMQMKVKEIMREQAMVEASSPQQVVYTSEYIPEDEPPPPAYSDVVRPPPPYSDALRPPPYSDAARGSPAPQAAQEEYRSKEPEAYAYEPPTHVPQREDDVQARPPFVEGGPLAVAEPEVDLLGLSATAPPLQAFASADSSSHEPVVADVGDVDDFFFGGMAAKTPSAPAAAQGGDLHDLLHSSGRPAPASAPREAGRYDAKLKSMIDLGELDSVDIAGYEHLYNNQEDGSHDEPELRKQLRAQRIAERHAKMKAALQDKLAKDEEESRKREAQVTLKEQYKEIILQWKNKHRGNIRGLLGSLQTVLWEGSGWSPIGVGDLLEPNQVKKAYMKANLVVHPDKVRQRNGPEDQVAIADMVFDVLKEAWGIFSK